MVNQGNKTLSKREKEILRLITEELSSMEIAEHLGLSLRTIETYRKRIIRKTGTSNPIGLFKYAVRNGYVKGFFATGLT